jgi:F-type H+-transporting ATPase subunit b
MEGLGINLGYLLMQLAMFGIIFVTLRVWVYKPVLGMIERRREKLSQSLEDAKIAAEARANAETEAAAVIVEAQGKASQIVKDATARAQQVEKDIKANAEVEIQKMRAAANVEIQAERERALKEMRSEIAALAIAAAQKLVGEALDEKRQHRLLEEFFSGIKDGRVIVLEGETISGESAEVTSAVELSGEERQTVEKELKSHLNKDAGIAFKVDPQIMGGMVIKVGDRVMDGSVLAQLQALNTALK